MTNFEIKAIHNYIEYLSKGGHFSTIDKILESVIVDSMVAGFDTGIAIEYLRATIEIKDKLDNRQYLINNVRDICDDQSILKYLE